MIIIQTTVDEQKKAQNLINLLLETNKIACGTFHEIQSAYKWKDELVEDSEIKISLYTCLLYTSPSPRDYAASRMPSSA